jgi:ribosome-binding protein aMBF1 (putative translation factor)
MIGSANDKNSHFTRKQRRIALGMSEAELAKLIGEKPTVVEAYEAGQVSFVDTAVTAAMEIALYRTEQTKAA